jgi:hypothetical protein
MKRAATNRIYPMIEQALRQLFDIRLEHDQALERFNRPSALRSSAFSPSDENGRIRIIYVDDVDDLHAGSWFTNTSIVGYNTFWNRMILVAVPPEIDAISTDCDHVPKTMEGYLLAVTLHELYENLTHDSRHCRNPGRCLNSVCRIHKNGTCCVCMGGLIDDRWPDLRLEELYCREHLEALNAVLQSGP